MAPSAGSLPRGVVHNDANDYNVLVGPASPHDRPIAGLLDFGDMVETWTVAEPAVAIAYAILGKSDPVAAAGALLSGYDAVRPLSDAELAAAWILAAIRLCTSVCLSAHRRSAEPDNAYLLVSEAPAWKALQTMRGIPARLAHYRLRAACGRVPCPQTPAIEAWLRAHRAEVGPVVEEDPERAVVFDLSVGSPVFSSPEEATDTAAMTRKLFGAMRSKGARLGVGRYDEARLLYASDAFAQPSDEQPERRTVHLAHDLFMEPGSAVLAPLPGCVRSVRDNAARLDYGPTVILEHAPAGVPAFFTLYGHLSRASTAHWMAGDSVARGDRVGEIGPAPENGDWPPHVHFQIIADLLDAEGDFPGVAPAAARAAWLSLCPDPNLILRGPERFRAPADGAAVLREDRRRRLGPSLSLSYREPLEIVRGAGASLYDETGRAYLDMVNNVAHVGHGHPRVVRAGARQMAVLNTNTRYLHPAIVRYAARLTATLPPPLSVCFFVCSGSEANELALRMARAASGGRGVVVVDGAYHGNTQTLVDVSPYKHAGPGGGGPPSWVRAAPMPDDYRGLHRRGDPERGAKFAAAIADAFASLFAAGEKPAAFLCESLLSCGGQIELPPGYLAASYAHARAAGAVCIADEVHRQQIQIRKLALHAFRLRFGLVDLVDRHDDRHVRRSRVIDRFFRLRHHSVVGSDDQHDDVGYLRPARTHPRERFVTRRIHEHHRTLAHHHLVRADVLRNSARFARRYVRFANRIEQARLAVIDVAHHRDHRRPRLQIFLGLFLRNLENHFLFEGNHAHDAIECFRDLRRRGNIKRLVDARENTAIHQRLQQILRANVELFREFANRDAFGDLHIARRARLWWSDDGRDTAATRTRTLTRRMQLPLAFHFALVRNRTLALRWFPRVKRFARLRLRRHFVRQRRQHARPSRRARTWPRTCRHRPTTLFKRSAWRSARTSRSTCTRRKCSALPTRPAARRQRSHRLPRSGPALTLSAAASVTSRSGTRHRPAISARRHRWPR